MPIGDELKRVVIENLSISEGVLQGCDSTESDFENVSIS